MRNGTIQKGLIERAKEGALKFRKGLTFKRGTTPRVKVGVMLAEEEQEKVEKSLKKE